MRSDERLTAENEIFLVERMDAAFPAIGYSADWRGKRRFIAPIRI
jgi:hypothetical protein